MKMTAQQTMNRMHRRYAGDTKYPSWGSDTAGMYLDIINDLKNDWATDEDHQWSSVWEERTFGETNSTDLAYDCDDDVNSLSDKVYIDTIDGRTVEFGVIKEKDRHKPNISHKCFLSSNNPKKINFTDMPTECIGGTIRAGIYFIPPDVTKANDIVPVDNPLWVVLAGAAELSFNDPSKQENFPDLNGLANAQYQKMIDAADTLPPDQVDSTPTVGFDDPAGGCN